MENQRNLLLAVVLSGLLILGWDVGMRYFYPQPDTPPVTATAPAAGVSESGGAPAAAGTAAPAGSLAASDTTC